MKKVYKTRYKALKHKSDYEVVTVKCDGGYINLTLHDLGLWKRTK